MAQADLRLGAKVRAMRREARLSQVQLAESLGISASYLNLIEHDRRPLPAALLIKLTQIFDVDVGRFAADDDEQLRADLLEVFSDPMFDAFALTSADVRELVSGSPAIARAVAELYRAHANARLGGPPLTGLGEPPPNQSVPSDEISDLLQSNSNYFPTLEERAEALWREGRLDRNDIYRELVRYLEQVHGITVRVVEVDAMHGAVKRYVPERRLLILSEVLAARSRNFQLAQHIGLLAHSAVIDEILAAKPLTNEVSRSLARVALANYFAGALLMPYQSFLDAAKAVRYDFELLGHRFRTSFEQVCHRVTNLRRPGGEGIPFHFLRVDIAGNISKRFSASGMHFARFSGACPRWNVFAAFLTPGTIRTQLSHMPDGSAYFSIARTTTKRAGSYGAPPSVHALEMGCDVRFAKELVYADGIDLQNVSAAVPIGVTCRLCERLDCAQRSVPPMNHPLRVDENVRGVSFYAPDRKVSG